MEDAEDGSTAGWRIYDQDPVGASINNIEDQGTRFISFDSSGIANGFILGSTTATNGGFNIGGKQYAS